MFSIVLTYISYLLLELSKRRQNIKTKTTVNINANVINFQFEKSSTWRLA